LIGASFLGLEVKKLIPGLKSGFGLVYSIIFNSLAFATASVRFWAESLP